MRRGRRVRWRETRDTLPARRRRRRSHRRDVERGGSYDPIEVDPGVALHGVRSRLLGAAGSAALTVACVAFGLLLSLGSFAGTFALTTACCSLGAAMGLLLSARHEERVHQLAATFEESNTALEPDDGSDGDVGRPQLLDHSSTLPALTTDLDETDGAP